MRSVLHKVLNRGVPPVSFIEALVNFALVAEDEIFAPNPNLEDVYALTRNVLGPWGNDLAHRRAGMLEVMRVHAGFESSWNWECGVDTTNRTSMRKIEGQETGAWQVSFDSLRLGHSAMVPFAEKKGIATPRLFIDRMKEDHLLAMEYYARLVRVSIKWAGPLVRREILPELRMDALEEFKALICAEQTRRQSLT